MNKIQAAFENKKAFVAYLMAGDPSLEKSRQYILDLQESGADLIEIGIPFSDPVAEGEVIQRANIRALDQQVRLKQVFEMVNSLKGEIHVPLVFLTYMNPVYNYGVKNFFEKCVEIGVSGIIIPDLPYEESQEIRIMGEDIGVDLISLIAPTSEDRITKIAKASKGYIYVVSSLGVTGARDNIKTDIESIVGKIKQVTDVPVAIGFGIHTPDQAKEYCKVADGVIIGSAIVSIIENNLEDASGALIEYGREIKGVI